MDPQPVMEYHVDGFYRWSINVIGWLHNTSRKLGRDMARFDEPVISMEWPRAIAPHRAGIVGESLFVHFQVR